MTPSPCECPDCGAQFDTLATSIAHRCPDERDEYDPRPTCATCAGEGYVDEQEYRNDWINYDRRFIVCPDCKGEG